ncbi:hypothetical protein J7M23_04220 [Candidatus Sumerlaeota bacterium]|nr:hypothetical protein [Candidatus Sumerlaeota bacterium]
MKSKFNLFLIIAIVPSVIVLGILAISSLYVSKTIYDLLRENKALKQAITNLTKETQIGYAKVISQERRDGRLFTRLLFVETDRDDPTRRILEKEYEIEGDIVYFDALIVKFGDQLVMDGKERALYLWRRVYGEKMSPADGYPIETPGAEPQRYADIFAKLSLKEKNLFWTEIWSLSNDPDRLKKAGVKAIYGNVVYKKLRPGLIYMFKISNTGTLYPEVVPDL